MRVFRGQRMHLIPIAILLLVSTPGTTQTPLSKQRMIEMLQSARARGTPELMNSSAFHLRASIETFDGTGKADGTGTLEELWDGDRRSRRTITFRDNSQTVIEDRGEYQTAELFQSSFLERLLIRGFFLSRFLRQPSYLNQI